MATKYASEAQDALDMITEFGAPVVFVADAWKGGTIAADVTGQAVEIEGDPDTLQTLNLIQRNPVTLIVAAQGLGLTVTPGLSFRWADKPYTVQLATPLAPDGTPIVWTVVGSS